MSRPLLVIISGAPSSGKTELGKKIAEEFKLPFLYKDGIKEMLFDTLGWSDREWTEELNKATYGILYHIIEAELKAGLSFVVEADFKPEEHNDKFHRLQREYEFIPFQIHCTAQDEALLKRFQKRARTDDRHPGHKDLENVENYKEELEEDKYVPLDIGGEQIVIDTTDRDKVDYSPVFRRLREALQEK